jgi:hypothetical protein
MELAMKRISYFLIGLCALALSACNESPLSVPTRNITVSGTLTKTTIDYEGDVSHLVWQEGDNVMYLTDDQAGLYDYGFQSAEVSGNSFTANISSAAGADNHLLVVWPSSATALGSSDTVIWMKKEVTLDSKAAFDGRTLPMVALTEVPSGSEVNVSYRPLCAVLRVAVDSLGHETEKLKSLKLTTEEQCIGRFLVSTSQDGGALYKGSTNTLTVTLSDTPSLGKLDYVYMVVAKGEYTGVKLEVDTDQATYSFENGTMDLSASDRGLYRISLTLPSDLPPVEEAKFVKVTSQDEITADGTYLILSAKSDTQYYVPSSSQTDSYLEAAVINCEADGSIVKTDDIMAYALAFVTDSAHEGQFAIRYDALGSKPYLKAPNNVSEAKNYIGSFWYGTESDLASGTNCWWTITAGEDGAAVTSHEFPYGEAGRHGSICYFKDGSKFGVNAPETDTDEFQDIVIFKLGE